jgi:hypothetical protein
MQNRALRLRRHSITREDNFHGTLVQLPERDGSGTIETVTGGARAARASRHSLEECMSNQVRRTVRALTCAAVAAGVLGVPAEAQAPVRLEAFAINMSGGPRTSTGTIQIGIDTWSPQAESERLVATLIEKGHDALLRELQDAPRKGFIRTSTSLGWTIHYARDFPGEDGTRRIVIATDRPMNFHEVRNQSRSTEYDFMFAEIRLNKDGRGEGKLSTATKVRFDKKKNQIELENWGIEPVRLNEVRLVEK